MDGRFIAFLFNGVRAGPNKNATRVVRDRVGLINMM